jgi:hypothetical protein
LKNFTTICVKVTAVQAVFKTWGLIDELAKMVKSG